MDTNKIYQSLDSKRDPDAKREELITYLKECAENLPSEDSERAKVAYDIAGLLSTDYARSLGSSDVLDNVLTLAGELEVADPTNDQKWLELQKMVNSL